MRFYPAYKGLCAWSIHYFFYSRVEAPLSVSPSVLYSRSANGSIFLSMQVRDGQKKLLLDAWLDPIRGSAEGCQPGFRVLHLNVFHTLWEHRRAQDEVQTRSRSVPHQRAHKLMRAKLEHARKKTKSNSPNREVNPFFVSYHFSCGVPSRGHFILRYFSSGPQYCTPVFSLATPS